VIATTLLSLVLAVLPVLPPLGGGLPPLCSAGEDGAGEPPPPPPHAASEAMTANRKAPKSTRTANMRIAATPAWMTSGWTSGILRQLAAGCLRRCEDAM
jgi:hypothetical protein